MNIKYILFALVACMVLVACNDAEGPIDNRIFLNEAIGLEKTTLFVIPDEGTQVTVTPRLAKALDHDLDVEVFVKADALEAYNQAYGTSYQLMDNERYTIVSNKVTIPAGHVAGEPVKVNLKALIPDENKSGFIYVLPLSVRSLNNDLAVLEASSTYFYAAQPVPMADVPQFQKYCTLKLPLGDDYEFENWTFETLFNGSAFPGIPTWLASAVGFNFTNGNHNIQCGFMLRLGDAGSNPPANCLNGRIQFAARGVGKIGFTPDVWHHVAIVSANKKVTVYVNGEADYSIDAPELHPTVKFFANQGIRLAGENRTGGNGMNRTTHYRYSQVRLWGEARSVEQLKNNMYGVPEDSPNLIGYWKLDSYTTGKATVNKLDNNITVDGSAETMEIDTYFFKDYTGKNPDGFVDRNPSENTEGLLFDVDKRIEIGYKYDGSKAD